MGITLLVSAAVVGGCLAPRQELVILARDPQTRAPAPGIAVGLTTLNPQHAFRPSDYTRWIVGGPERDGPHTLTDADGSAILLAPTDRPFAINLLIPSAAGPRIPETLFFRESAQGQFETIDWTPLPIQPDGTPTIEIRVEPRPR